MSNSRLIIKDILVIILSINDETGLILFAHCPVFHCRFMLLEEFFLTNVKL